MARRRSKVTAPPPEPGAATLDLPFDDRVERLSAALGIALRDPELLRLALTHRSVVHDYIAAGGDATSAAAATNERLEFLGDAILDAIVAEYLYSLYPLANEGQLTQWRAALVRAESLVRWARQIDLGDFTYLGNGEQPSSSGRDRILATGFEALIGAIATDSGYTAALGFMLPFLQRDAASLIAVADRLANPKGRLQEHFLEQHGATPHYRVIDATGPEHAREFTVAVSFGDAVLGTGTGSSKREAEQEAAAAALVKLQSGPDEAGVPPEEQADPVSALDAEIPSDEGTAAMDVDPPGR